MAEDARTGTRESYCVKDIIEGLVCVEVYSHVVAEIVKICD